MSNQSRQLYHAFVKRGMQKEDAFFAVLDHFCNLHYHDRDILTAQVKNLKDRVASLETKGQAE